MRYDKLIIDNDMYKYDERNEQIVPFGDARARVGMRPLGGRQGETSNTQGILDKDQADNEDDNEAGIRTRGRRARETHSQSNETARSDVGVGGQHYAQSVISE